MKCEIVRDLLPLYDEKLCSKESAELVEEHIKGCASCKELLEKFPSEKPPEVDMDGIKPFVKVKRKLRARIIALISLGVVLLAVLIPVGFLTVNQIFHIYNGTDFEDIIYKSEIRPFAEMLAEGRMEEYVESLTNMGILTSDGTTVSSREIYLEKLQSAYEKVKKYEPRVGEIYSKYYRSHINEGEIWREQYFYLEFTRPNGSVFQVRIDRSLADSSEKNGISWQIPVEISRLYDYDPEKNNYENYSGMEEYSPDDLREICAYINTLYLADGGDLDITAIEHLVPKWSSDALPDDYIDRIANFIAMNFEVSDYKAVYNGIADLKKSNYIIESAISAKEYDVERNMFYYPVMLMGYDGEHFAVVSIKLYYDEFGFHTPRSEDIKGVTGNSDLEIKLAGIFG